MPKLETDGDLLHAGGYEMTQAMKEAVDKLISKSQKDGEELCLGCLVRSIFDLMATYANKYNQTPDLLIELCLKTMIGSDHRHGIPHLLKCLKNTIEGIDGVSAELNNVNDDGSTIEFNAGSKPRHLH